MKYTFSIVSFLIFCFRDGFSRKSSKSILYLGTQKLRQRKEQKHRIITTALPHVNHTSPTLNTRGNHKHNDKTKDFVGKCFMEESFLNACEDISFKSANTLHKTTDDLLGYDYMCKRVNQACRFLPRLNKNRCTDTCSLVRELSNSKPCLSAGKAGNSNTSDKSKTQSSCIYVRGNRSTFPQCTSTCCPKGTVGILKMNIPPKQSTGIINCKADIGSILKNGGGKKVYNDLRKRHIQCRVSCYGTSPELKVNTHAGLDNNGEIFGPERGYGAQCHLVKLKQSNKIVQCDICPPKTMYNFGNCISLPQSIDYENEPQICPENMFAMVPSDGGQPRVCGCKPKFTRLGNTCVTECAPFIKTYSCSDKRIKRKKECVGGYCEGNPAKRTKSVCGAGRKGIAGLMSPIPVEESTLELWKPRVWSATKVISSSVFQEIQHDDSRECRTCINCNEDDSKGRIQYWSGGCRDGITPTKCTDCDVECALGCTGPSNNQCSGKCSLVNGKWHCQDSSLLFGLPNTRCRNVRKGNLCLKSCPKLWYHNGDRICKQCSHVKDGQIICPKETYWKSGCKGTALGKPKEILPPSFGLDTMCAPCTRCPANYYRYSGCTLNKDSICAKCNERCNDCWDTPHFTGTYDRCKRCKDKGGQFKVSSEDFFWQGNGLAWTEGAQDGSCLPKCNPGYYWKWQSGHKVCIKCTDCGDRGWIGPYDICGSGDGTRDRTCCNEQCITNTGTSGCEYPGTNLECHKCRDLIVFDNTESGVSIKSSYARTINKKCGEGMGAKSLIFSYEDILNEGLCWEKCQSNKKCNCATFYNRGVQGPKKCSLFVQCFLSSNNRDPSKKCDSSKSSLGWTVLTPLSFKRHEQLVCSTPESGGSGAAVNLKPDIGVEVASEAECFELCQATSGCNCVSIYRNPQLVGIDREKCIWDTENNRCKNDTFTCFFRSLCVTDKCKNVIGYTTLTSRRTNTQRCMKECPSGMTTIARIFPPHTLKECIPCRKCSLPKIEIIKCTSNNDACCGILGKSKDACRKEKAPLQNVPCLGDFVLQDGICQRAPCKDGFIVVRSTKGDHICKRCDPTTSVVQFDVKKNPDGWRNPPGITLGDKCVSVNSANPYICDKGYRWFKDKTTRGLKQCRPCTNCKGSGVVCKPQHVNPMTGLCDVCGLGGIQESIDRQCCHKECLTDKVPKINDIFQPWGCTTANDPKSCHKCRNTTILTYVVGSKGSYGFCQARHENACKECGKECFLSSISNVDKRVYNAAKAKCEALYEDPFRSPKAMCEFILTTSPTGEKIYKCAPKYIFFCKRNDKKHCIESRACQWIEREGKTTEIKECVEDKTCTCYGPTKSMYGIGSDSGPVDHTGDKEPGGGSGNIGNSSNSGPSGDSGGPTGSSSDSTDDSGPSGDSGGPTGSSSDSTGGSVHSGGSRHEDCDNPRGVVVVNGSIKQCLAICHELGEPFETQNHECKKKCSDGWRWESITGKNGKVFKVCKPCTYCGDRGYADRSGTAFKNVDFCGSGDICFIFFQFRVFCFGFRTKFCT